MASPTRDQVLALAGVFQACQLVDTLARTGTVLPEALGTAINSLLNQSPESCEDVFGSTTNLAYGLDTMAELIALGQRSKQSDILRYVLGILFLHRKLLRNSKMMAQLSEGINKANEQAKHFSPTHDNVIGGLADLYRNTVSTFTFRIQVNGQGGFLTQTHIANRVRCLLFAGIRAAILWRQLGGRRWHLIIYRRQILEQLNQIRRQL